MNIVQEILVIVLKGMCYRLFAENLTEQESDFLRKMEKSNLFRSIQIQNTLDGKSVLTWQSAIEKSVACPVTDTGIFFSETEVYSQRERSLSCTVGYNFPGDREKVKCVEAEIEEIKTLFMSYSIDAEVYFK